MTSRERILTVLRGDLPDRVPVWQWGVHPWLTGVHPSIQPVVDAFLARGDTIHWWSPGAATFLTASDQLTVTGAQQPSELPDFDQHTATYHTPAGDLTEITYASRTGKPGYRKKYLLETEADVPSSSPSPTCRTGLTAPPSTPSTASSATAACRWSASPRTRCTM